MLLQIVSYQADDLSGLSMAAQRQFREEQLLVHCHLKTSSIGGDDRDGFDVGLELLQQIRCQTDSPIGVVSGSTVNQFDVQHNSPPERMFRVESR
jgi:hypothetical protein